jgi:hypothetical protein
MGITSRFYYKNIIKRAEDGLGDGTVYASATTATPDQDEKTFTLTGLSILTDFGADADDKFNAMILYFTASENIYHIVDWTDSGDVATVFETPASGDTGACEIRLNLFAQDTDGSYPVHNLADGKRSTAWMGSAGGQAQTIRVFMPNFVGDGGFEAQSVGNLASPWSAQSTQWQASSTSPLLGSRMAVYTQSAADAYLKQNLVGTVEKGKTVRILMKAQAIGANPSGAVMSVKVVQKLAPYKVIDSGMDWQPTITTAAGWVETTFTADFTSDMLMLIIDALGSTGSWGSCTGFNLDEFYIYEDIPVDRLIALDHSFNNGEITSLYGCRCNPARTSYAAGNDASANLIAAVDIDGTEPVVQSVTESNYPVWELVLTAATGITYYAAIIFLGPAMTFTKQMLAPFDPDAETVGGTMSETQSGRRVFYPDYYRGGPYRMVFSKINSTFYDKLKDWWEEVGRTRFPYLFCFDETNYPERIKLLRNESDRLFAYDPVLRSGAIDSTEEL